MKVITEPTVTLVAKTVFLGHPDYPIPEGGTDAERLGAFAAKGCYDSYGTEGRSVEDNQRAVIESKHGSVLEHSHASVFVEGVTRGLTLEMNRHRQLGISQRSTRYTREEDAAIVLEPDYAKVWNEHNMRFDVIENSQVIPHPAGRYKYVWANDQLYGVRDGRKFPTEVHVVARHVEEAQRSIRWYAEEAEILIKWNPYNKSGFDLRKWARGKARNSLPHSLETRATYTANYRAWRHFIELRSERYAEPEIRRLAGKIFDVLQPLAPTYFEDYEVIDVDYLREFTTAFKKV